MILRRVIEHFRKQEWTAIALDFVIVVMGVYTAVWVQAAQRRADERIRTEQVIETLRSDLSDSTSVEMRFFDDINAGLAEWQEDFDAGLKPPPYFFRTPGADTPPVKTWEALLNMNVGQLLNPKLVFELAFYYSEREGVAAKYIRYVTFVENEIMPLLLEDPSVFYVEDGSRLKPEFEMSMMRLADWNRESQINMRWAICLSERMNHPREAGAPCRPEFSTEKSGPGAFRKELAP